MIMAGPMKRTKEEIERERARRLLDLFRREAPLSRPLVISVRVIEAIAEVGGELVEALILGLRAGLWLAFVIFGFGAAFFGIGVALYAVVAWLVGMFAV